MGPKTIIIIHKIKFLVPKITIVINEKRQALKNLRFVMNINGILSMRSSE